ncbi:hypothetical protein L1049_028270 [Liquidambar formosana]|uniref:Uncharacterized protein n=1 Tax=Liquidambar formosana TaxID=63359 RepID=A0AAP0WW26_LIQFO
MGHLSFVLIIWTLMLILVLQFCRRIQIYVPGICWSIKSLASGSVYGFELPIDNAWFNEMEDVNFRDPELVRHFQDALKSVSLNTSLSVRWNSSEPLRQRSSLQACVLENHLKEVGCVRSRADMEID